MNVITAAAVTKALIFKSNSEWRNVVPCKNRKNAHAMDHLLWLLEGVIDEYVTGDQAHRWLSWVQSALYSYEKNTFSVEVFMDINKNS